MSRFGVAFCIAIRAFVHSFYGRFYGKILVHALLWIENKIALDDHFNSKILFSNETNFCLNGYVKNKLPDLECRTTRDYYSDGLVNFMGQYNIALEMMPVRT